MKIDQVSGGHTVLSIHVCCMYETRLRSTSVDAWSSRAVNAGLICSKEWKCRQFLYIFVGAVL